MRYYELHITPKNGPKKVFTSYVNGRTIPGALNIELDILTYDFSVPMGASILRIWGISISDISQSSDLNGGTIDIYGGMQAGLPLANPKNSGLLLSGLIFQAFGNWQGSEMTLDFVIQVNTVSGSNLVLNGKKGQNLIDAAKQSLAEVYPGFKVTVNTAQTFTLNEDYPAHFANVIQFAQGLKQISKSLITTPDYRGLSLVVRQNEIVIYDGSSSPSNPKQILFTDLIGQCTWIDFATVQFKAVMRSDLNVGDYILLPQGQFSLGAKSYPAFKDTAAFSTSSKPFQIKQIRHVGNYRNPDASSWVTVVDCFIT